MCWALPPSLLPALHMPLPPPFPRTKCTGPSLWVIGAWGSPDPICRETGSEPKSLMELSSYCWGNPRQSQSQRPVPVLGAGESPQGKAEASVWLLRSFMLTLGARYSGGWILPRVGQRFQCLGEMPVLLGTLGQEGSGPGCCSGPGRHRVLSSLSGGEHQAR